ncbi:hypothetical protein D9611_002382 [Ephemerocybe angulata]|uniref:DUF952 domain-containing protein n=1 Tax=Ephemerocybe angulata TaxID=980116 RepID=A0A8H5C1Q2_9AGAR|nr:hypothetical protein D9611_002379 [Tulosesus angulatus]KAF5333378.1 hypothetical protein D9611_002382 [Tulosesus angulatus]
MTESTSTPTYLYKIVPESAAPPDPLPDRLPVSALDEQDGFIHLSTAKQVLGTLNRFFANDQKIYLLRLEYTKVKELIKWENHQREEGKEGAEGYFPHIYNGNNLGKKEVESVSSVNRKEGEDSWEQALASIAGWFAY